MFAVVILKKQSNFHTWGDTPKFILNGKHGAGEGLTKPTSLYIVVPSSFHTFLYHGDNEGDISLQCHLGTCVPIPPEGTG